MTKRWLHGVGLAVVLAAAPAAAVDVGFGVAGGLSVPLGQADNGNGGTFELRVPVRVHPLLTAEAFLQRSEMGDITATFDGAQYSRNGLDGYAGGAILALGGVGLGPRFPLYPYVGGGVFHLSREGTPAETHPGYLVGGGYARPVADRFVVDARAAYNWVTLESTARRYFTMDLGVIIRLHPGPEEKF